MHIEVLHEYKPGNVWSEEELKKLTTIEVDAGKMENKSLDEQENYAESLIKEWIKTNPNFKYKGFKFFYDKDRYVILRDIPFSRLNYYIEVVDNLKSFSTIKIDAKELENKSLIEQIEYAKKVMNEWIKNHSNIKYTTFHFYYEVGNYIDLIKIDKVYEDEFEYYFDEKEEKIKIYSMLANKEIDLKHNQIMITLNCIMDLYASKDVLIENVRDVLIPEAANIDIKVILEISPYLEQNLDRFLEDITKDNSILYYLFEEKDKGVVQFLTDNFNIKSIDGLEQSFYSKITLKKDILLPNNKISKYSFKEYYLDCWCDSDGMFVPAY